MTETDWHNQSGVASALCDSYSNVDESIAKRASRTVVPYATDIDDNDRTHVSLLLNIGAYECLFCQIVYLKFPFWHSGEYRGNERRKGDSF